MGRTVDVDPFCIYSIIRRNPIGEVVGWFEHSQVKNVDRRTCALADRVHTGCLGFSPPTASRG